MNALPFRIWQNRWLLFRISLLFWFGLGIIAESSGQLTFNGSETQVHTTTLNTQKRPAIAMDSSGNYLIVWESLGNDGSGFGIYGQRYNAGGTPNGPEFLINSTTNADQRRPDVAMDETGRSVVVWMDQMADGSGWGIYAQRYDNTGAPFLTEFKVNGSSADHQKFPKVAMSPTGEFVVTYMEVALDGSSFHIEAKRYSFSGALSAEFTVDVASASFQGYPDVVLDSDANFVITWQREGLDGDGQGIAARLYDNMNTPVPLAAPFQVNTTTTDNQQAPSIGIDSSGNFIIIWTSYNQDGDAEGIYGQKYTPTATPIGSEIQISSTTTGAQTEPAVTMTREGHFIAAWSSYGQDGSFTGVYLQLFDQACNSIGPEFLVNTNTTDFQQMPALAQNKFDAELVLAWQDGRRFLTTTNDGNDYGVYSQRMTWIVNNPPVAICQDLTVNADGNCQGTATAAQIDNGSFDPEGTTVTLSISPTGPFSLGNTTVILTVTDSTGLTDTCSATVTVVDNTLPTISCPANITVNNDPGQCSAAVSYTSPSGNDNCPGFTINQSAGLASGAAFPVGTTTNTFIITDGSGNQDSCSFTVTVIDNELPTIMCPSNITVNNATGMCAATVMYTSPIANDNCTGFTVNQSAGLPSGGSFPVGTTTNTFLVTDASGNSAICSFTVTVVDNEAPTINCPANITMNNDAGLCSATVTYTLPTASDNCPGVTVSLLSGPVSGSSFSVGTTTVSYLATDAAGLTDTCDFSVTVVDNEAPSISCPANITMNNDPGQCAAVVIYTPPTGTDNCPNPMTTLLSGLPSGSSFPVGTSIVSYMVTDAAGNTDTCDFMIMVVDNEAPTISCPSDVTVNVDQGMCSASNVNLGNPTINDNCPAATAANNAPASFPVGTTAVTWTATDAAGLTATCMQNVTVIDNEAPVINCPANITVGNDTGMCGANVTYMTTATDNCPGVSFTCSQASGTFFPVGTTMVSCTATDVAGNQSSCSFNIVVNDTEAPTISCPADVTVNADPGQCAATNVSLGSPTINDNCPGASAANNAPNSFPVGNTVVTWTVTDASGLTATCMQNVLVVDNEAPTISCPADVTVNVDPGQCEATNVALGSPSINDNCPGATASNNAPASFPVGTTAVTWTVTDAGGLTATCMQNVTVIDNEAPVINCPANITVGNDAGQCGAIVNYITTATDNCPGVSFTCTQASGTFFPVGTTQVSCTATDAAGNQSTCSFNIIVDDTEAPNAICQDITVYLDAAGNVSISPTQINNGSTDNCGILSLSLNDTDFNCTDAANNPNPVTLTVTDLSGNQSSCGANVTVLDTLPPVAMCADISVYLDINGEYILSGLDLAALSAGSTDNCGISSIVASQDTFDCDDYNPVQGFGLVSVTVTVTDVFGNSSNCNANVTVFDTLNACCDIMIADVQKTDEVCPNAEDGTITVNATCTTCVGIQYSVDGGANFQPGNFFDNLADGTYMVIVQDTGDPDCADTTFVTIEPGVDNEDPQITCPADVIVECDADNSPTATGTATATDNCTPNPFINFSDAIVNGTCPSNYIIVRTWTATDSVGNSATCVQNITVIDTVAPVFTCPAAIEVDADGNCQAVVTYSATATDNCDASVVVIFNPPSGSVFGLGLTTVTATATDSCGNSSTCSFIVSVEDNTPPVITCPADVVRACDENTSPSSTGTATATDNCTANPVINFSDLISAGSCTGNYTIFRSWTATDEAGNSASCVQTITVIDTVAPTISCPADLTIECTESTDPSINMSLGMALAGDNCADSSDIFISYTDAITPGACPNGYTITRTWTAVDDCNNISSCTQIITVEDTQAPVPPAAPADVTVECMADVPAPAFLMAQDNCDGMIVGVASDSITPGACVNEYTITRTWLFKDGCNNAVTVSQTIVVDDNTAPDAPDLPDLSFQCADDVPAPPAVVTALDNCDGVIVGVFNEVTTPGSCVNNFVVTRTWIFVDACGNQSSEVQTITVNDDTDPVASCPPDVSGLQCGDTPPAAATTIADFLALGGVVGDNCTATGDISISSSDSDNGNTECVSDGIRVITRTYTFTDECGNSTSCDQTFTYDEDTSAPDITCPADESDLDCNYVVPAGATDIASFLALGGTASDNCTATADLSVSYVDNDNMTLSCPGDARVIVRTYTITDGCGNSATCDQTFTYEEITTPPVINCPPDLVCLCGNPNNPLLISNWLNSVTASSDCPLSVSITNDYPNGIFTPDCGNAGTQEVTFTATDACGNTSTCTANIVLVDNNPPELDCPAPLTIGTDAGVCEADIAAGILSISAFDKCDPNFTVVNNSAYALDNNSADAAGVYPVGNHLITFTATDACGNVSSCTIDLTVEDDELPQISCPANIVVDADPGTCGAVVTFSLPSYSDNCPGAMLTQISGMNSGDTFPTGMTIQEYSVMDAAGNAITCSFTITVNNTLSSLCSVTGYAVGTPADYGLYLGNLPGVANPGYHWQGGSGTLAVFLDGTATITGTIVNKADANVVFDVYILLENEMDWATWSALGRNYKFNAFNQATALANHPNWTFWEMSNSSTLTGAPGSTYDGDVLHLDPKPADYSYGFQLGLAANDKDNDYGISGWFYYSGTLGGQSVSGDGDVNGDASCQANPCGAGIAIAPRVMFEGSFNSSNQLMDDDLRIAGWVPLTEPFSALGFNYLGGGGESISTTVLSQSGNDAIVDWVAIELSHSTNPGQPIASRAALIQRDGDIVDLDGTSPIGFLALADGLYHVAIYHRSHIPVMSENPYLLSSASTYLDFANGSVASFGSNATKALSGGLLGMYCGDADFNHVINSADRALLWNHRNETGYLNWDVNLDGACTAADRSYGWNNRNETKKF